MKLYVSEVDKNSLQLINTIHLFSCQQDNVGLFKLIKAADKEIILRTSKDQSKLLVVAQGNDEGIFSCVFGKDFQILRKKTSKLKLSDDLQVFDATIGNNGNNVVAIGKRGYSFETFNSSIVQKLLIQNQIIPNVSWILKHGALALKFGMLVFRFQMIRQKCLRSETIPERWQMPVSGFQKFRLIN
jgi:hypothetical protein